MVNGKPSLQLSIKKTVSTYQDTNGWKDEEKWRGTYEVGHWAIVAGVQGLRVCIRV